MTSNLAESMNNVFKGIRNLPKIALVKSTYYRLASLFAERGENTNIRLKTNQAYTKHCMNTLKAEVIKPQTHEVNQFDWEMHTFLSAKLSTTRREGQRELSRSTCMQSGMIVENFRLSICLFHMS